MLHKVLLSYMLVVSVGSFTVPMALGATFSKVIQEGSNTFIVDLHGERWDVTQAKSIGFVPERFRHGIGRDAFTPLDDSYLSDDSRNASRSLRVIGIADEDKANAYSVRKLWRHEIANSRIGDKPIAAAY